MSDHIIVRLANTGDIPKVKTLLERYHSKNLVGEERANGFVTTDMTESQLADLINLERGLAVAIDEAENDLVGLLIGASWQFLSAWPMFEYMTNILDQYECQNTTLTPDNSYQYGPICIDESHRSLGIGEKLIECQRKEFQSRYPIMATFINKLNPRSFKFHKRNNFEELGTFSFNNNEYWLLAKPTKEMDS